MLAPSPPGVWWCLPWCCGRCPRQHERRIQENHGKSTSHASILIWLSKTVVLKNVHILDWKYDRKVAKNLRSCQDNFCWEGPYQDISITSGVATAISIFFEEIPLVFQSWTHILWTNPSLFCSGYRLFHLCHHDSWLCPGYQTQLCATPSQGGHKGRAIIPPNTS